MKSKKILTILLSLAIMFTFMPAMAFAEGEGTSAEPAVTTVNPDDNVGVEWGTDFKTATYNEKPADVAWTFSNGLTTATASYNNEVKGKAYFYDFTGATLKLSSSMDKTTYDGLDTLNATVIMQKPSTATGDATAEVSSFTGWDVKYSVDKTVKSGAAKVEAKITVQNASNLPDMDGKHGNTKPAYFGTIVAKDVNVDAVSTPVTGFYDAADTTKTVKTSITDQYDGKEHTLTIDPVTGYSLKLEKYSNGHWEEVKEVKYKDVEDSVTYRATYTKTAVKTSFDPSNLQPTVTIALTANTNRTWAWTAKNGTTTANSGKYDYEVTAKQAETPETFIEVSKALNDADAEELKAVWNEFFTVKVTENAVDSNIKTWQTASKFKTNDEYDAAVTASEKAHKILFANYGLKGTGFLQATDKAAYVGKATMKVLVTGSGEVVNDKDDDITFSGVTNKTFKAKKKTKKLAKAQTLAVKVANDSGNAMTFTYKTTDKKVTFDAKTMKIKVKKGTKKGTYKVTVKAKTAAGNGYKAAKESQVYTIKVK